VFEPFLVSTGVVALAEMGDKTQLLAMVLAARYRQPWPILAGILIATIVNHALAGGVGVLLSKSLDPEILHWILVASFLAMAVWILIPDKIDDDETSVRSKLGVLGTTIVTFFLAEMGDKTQVATVALAARFDEWLPVVCGTTLGMMLANGPAIWIGDRLAGRLPVKLIHAVAAVLFLVMGVLLLLKGPTSGI